MRAEALAVGLAEALHGLAQDDVVAQSGAQRDPISLIKGEIDLPLFQLHLDVVFDFRLRPEEQIQYRVDMLLSRIEAAVAGAIEINLNRTPDANFSESVLKQLGLAGSSEQAILVQVLAEVDLPGA